MIETMIILPALIIALVICAIAYFNGVCRTALTGIIVSFILVGLGFLLAYVTQRIEWAWFVEVGVFTTIVCGILGFFGALFTKPSLKKLLMLATMPIFVWACLFALFGTESYSAHELNHLEKVNSHKRTRR